MHKRNPELPQEMRLLRIQVDDVGLRLDRYLTSVLTSLSRTTVQQLIVDGSILVNGQPGKPG